MIPEGAISWPRLSGFIADAMGLHFPQERYTDLQRGLAGAAEEFGFDNLAACADWLLSAPLTQAQLHVLAHHLTIGETYFFRDKQTLDVIADRILPELIASRRGREQRLRLWSAGCCTGEEPYSLAILLRQALPDLAHWHVTLLATDINPHFLRQAEAGSYGEWSFRGAPPGIKERYFTRNGEGRYAIVPEIKEMVTFAYLNLVDNVYPSLATGTNAMDVIFCRNMLMYFTPAQARKVVGNFHHALLDGGWMLVSPSEASHELFPQFATRNFPGVILFQKSGPRARGRQTVELPPPGEVMEDFLTKPEPGPWPGRASDLPPAPAVSQARPPEPLPALPLPEPELTRPTPYALAVSLFEQGSYAEAADTLLASLDGRRPGEPGAMPLLARALANQGRLVDALTWCDRWLAADKLDAAGHYLRAAVLIEKGEPGEARRSLQRAVYLRPDFVVAHFSLGNLARSNGKPIEAAQHFGNALQLLSRYQPADLLVESDGLTAGQLAEAITALASLGSAP